MSARTRRWAGDKDGTNTEALRRRIDLALKRGLDIAVAATALILALPLMAIIAIAIVVESPGPLFYRARRAGYRGRPLAMLKFRKMRHDAAGAPLTLADDPRLTRVGAVLAATRLDELPQLWHVLRGDMSLVGPRPEDPRFVAMRRGDFDEILTIRPGLTGLSQLAFAEERAILAGKDPIACYTTRLLPQKCALDRLYARKASVALDLRIAWWTAAAVLLRRQVAVHRGTGRLTLRRRPAPVAVAGQPPVAVARPAAAVAIAEPPVALADAAAAVATEDTAPAVARLTG